MRKRLFLLNAQVTFIDKRVMSFLMFLQMNNQFSRLERIHEENAFGGSALASENDHLANAIQPSNFPYRLLT